MNKSLLTLFLFGLAIVSFIMQQVELSTAGQQANLLTVSKISDGDTVEVVIDGEEKSVRLIGVDTPEINDPRKSVECFGQEASKATKDFLGSSRIRLEYDESQGATDRFGRELAYVFREDGLMLNSWLIHEGYAREYTYDDPYLYQSEFKIFENDAKENMRGLWSACSEF